MIFLDEDYKIDCENKIKYDHLIKITPNYSLGGGDIIGNHIFNASTIYTDADAQNPIFIAIGGNGFFVKDVKFCKEIFQNTYKISLKPYVASKTAINRQNRALSN